jgi:plastocyanin
VRLLGPALAICLLAPASAAFADDEANATFDMQIVTFTPFEVHIPAGGMVLWSNTSILGHTVTADDGSFDSGNLDPGATYTMTFDTPGTYAFYCLPHGGVGGRGMAGTVIVDEA